MPEGESARPRNAALDGVRGVAIAAVLLYHGDVKWAVGGYLGVDMFFVLSGYLITALLLEELDRNRRLDLVGFWDRRLRRLLPAVLLLLLGV
ncbi:MAG TPA: acyltransferase family protein, partial [Acidimicrobiia bacterium]